MILVQEDLLPCVFSFFYFLIQYFLLGDAYCILALIDNEQQNLPAKIFPSPEIEGSLGSACTPVHNFCVASHVEVRKTRMSSNLGLSGSLVQGL